MEVTFNAKNVLQAIIGANVNLQITGRSRPAFLERVGDGLRSNDALSTLELDEGVNQAVDIGIITVEEAETYFRRPNNG